MLGGDISNEAPKTLMVCVDCFLDTKTETVKRFLRGTQEVHRKTLNVRAANLFNRAYTKVDGFTFECFSVDGSKLGEWEDRLDRLNLNPYRYWTVYASPSELVQELAYRPGVIGVIDIPERSGIYGSRAMDMNRLIAL